MISAVVLSKHAIANRLSQVGQLFQAWVGSVSIYWSARLQGPVDQHGLKVQIGSVASQISSVSGFRSSLLQGMGQLVLEHR